MRSAILFGALVILIARAAPAQSSAGYRIEADVFDNGGLGRASPAGPSFVATSIIGQSAGLLRSASLSYAASSGYVCAVCADSVASAVPGIPRPGEVRLDQNYPNPFSSITTIRFTLDRPQRVRLRIFTLLGGEVALVREEPFPEGAHLLQWDAGNARAGVYVYRLEGADWIVSRMLTVVR